MKRLFVSSLAVVAIAGWTCLQAVGDEKRAESKGDQGDKPEVKTIHGEVVDLACYLGHGSKGDKHKQCATECINGGLPVGILTDKDVYLIIGDHKPINDKLAPLAAQKIKVTGEVSKRNGVHLIVVKDPAKDIVKE